MVKLSILTIFVTLVLILNSIAVIRHFTKTKSIIHTNYTKLYRGNVTV